MPDPTHTTATVVAVVVTFHPQVATSSALLAALAPQVDLVIVVDNGSPELAVRALSAATAEIGGELVPLSVNRGIAAAQNVGIELARSRGATHILLSDQDSLPAPDMVERLLDGLRRAQELGPTAAVGPLTVDARNPGAALLFSDHRRGPRRATIPADEGALVEASFLIASGCLLGLPALDEVGMMNEEWFIDHIDLEWGLRARRAGYRLFGVVGATLTHELGDRTQHVPGRSRLVHIHSPVRNYYMARNTVLLIRSDLMRPGWRWGYAAWLAKYMAFYVLAVAPRSRRAGLLAQGAFDGLRGRTGPRSVA